MSCTMSAHLQSQVDGHVDSDGPAASADSSCAVSRPTSPQTITTALLDSQSTEVEGMARSEFRPLATRPADILDHTRSTRPSLPLSSTSECLMVLSGVCGKLSTETTQEIVSLSNDPAPQQILTQKLLPEYFYSWDLKSPIAVLVSLLLHCFMYQRDLHKHAEGRLVFEEHIHGLKERIASYQTQLSELSSAQKSDGESSKVCYHSDDVGCYGDEGARLRDELSTLRNENLKMQTSYEDLCRINHQWSLDYDTLLQQVTSTKSTGFSSSASNSSQVGEASHHHGILMSPSAEQNRSRCFDCHSSATALRELQKERDSLRQELKNVKRTKERAEKERDLEVNENKAIQIQLQELGDLRQARAIKDDYSRMQQEVVQLKKQYRDEFSGRLKLNKQVDRLREVFLQLFPFTASYNATPYPTGGRGYASYPAHLRPCRVQQQFYSDPGPPTPPGLIARGNTLSSLVEKDDRSLTLSRDEQVTGLERPMIKLEGYQVPPHSWHGAHTNAQERSLSAPLLVTPPEKDKPSMIVNGCGQSKSLATPTPHTSVTPTKHTLTPSQHTLHPPRSLKRVRPKSLIDSSTSTDVGGTPRDSTYLVRSLVDFDQINLSNISPETTPLNSLRTNNLHSSNPSLNYSQQSTNPIRTKNVTASAVLDHTHKPSSFDHAHKSLSFEHAQKPPALDSTYKSMSFDHTHMPSSHDHTHKSLSVEPTHKSLSFDNTHMPLSHDHTHNQRYDQNRHIEAQFANGSDSTDGPASYLIDVTNSGPVPRSQSAGAPMSQGELKCLYCFKLFARTSDGFEHWFDHIRLCGT